MNTIYLIGFMGSGKSTIGKHLKEILHIQFIDIDEQVEKMQQKSISEIFTTEGEKAFRQYESAILRTISYENFIISTGGGIVEEQENVDWMRQTGMIVFLKTSFNTIAKRLQHDKERPLWNQDVQRKLELFEKRNVLYQACADVIINTDHKDVISVANEICTKIVSE